MLQEQRDILSLHSDSTAHCHVRVAEPGCFRKYRLGLLLLYFNLLLTFLTYSEVPRARPGAPVPYGGPVRCSCCLFAAYFLGLHSVHDVSTQHTDLRVHTIISARNHLVWGSILSLKFYVQHSLAFTVLFLRLRGSTPMELPCSRCIYYSRRPGASAPPSSWYGRATLSHCISTGLILERTQHNLEGAEMAHSSAHFLMAYFQAFGGNR